MKAVNAYLMFAGNCREAVNFYAKNLGGEIWMMTYGESPMPCPEGAKDQIMHASVMIQGAAVVMASDAPPGTPVSGGSDISLAIKCESAAEAERMFAAFSEGGTVVMPLQETFWAIRFGVLKDRFGVQWMFNFEKPMGS